jgi:hypothetical protein
MHLFQHLNKTLEKHALSALDTIVHTVHLDYSRGETDWTIVLFFEKNKVSFEAALAILPLRMKMYAEEWGDFAHYNHEDIVRWLGFLEADYEDSIFIENIEKEVFEANFFVKRMQLPDNLKNLTLNAEIIDFDTFKAQNPLFSEKIKHVAQSKFEGLRTEYYVETERHFVLFHWFTTA